MMRRLAFALLLLATPAAGARQAWTIDPARTNIGFAIAAVGYAETRGEFLAFDGRLTVDLDQPGKSEARFTVKAASVDTGSPGVDAYIKSVFFDAARFPEIRFASTKVEKADARTILVTGDLTLLGVTRPATFRVEVEQKSGGARKVLGFLARGVIRRSDFGMIVGLPIVADDVVITVSTEALAE